MENKKISIKNMYLILLISLSLIGLAVGSTYAMFTASATINNPIAIASNLTSDSEVFNAIDVTVASGETKKVTLTLSNATSVNRNYTSWYTNAGSNIEVFYDPNGEAPTGTVATSATKDIIAVIKNSGTDAASVTVGISSSSSTIVLATGMTAITEEYKEIVPISTYITNLYTSAPKTEITNVSTGSGVNYNYAPSVNLMSDRLGGTTASLDDGNIRYYGANPNNYIYFNCSNYSNQSTDTCELWRIIGVTKTGNVKIIRNESIGNLAWDQDKNNTSTLTTYDNNFETATFQTLLNDNYYNGSGLLTYYSGNAGTQSTSLNMTNIGLKNTATRNKIIEAEWFLGGVDDKEGTVLSIEEMYDNERNGKVYEERKLTWNGNIALMYPSDYNYALDIKTCQGDSVMSDCYKYNWLYQSNINQWLLTPSSLSNNQAFYAPYVSNPDGRIGTQVSDTYNAYAIRPTLYLNSNQLVAGGDGTKSSPYQLGA